MKVLVASWAGSTNLGDELILAALLAKLAARRAHVSVISTVPDATSRDHSVPAVGHLDPQALWRATGQADAVVFGGGGLIQDETSPFNLPYHLSRTWLARLRDVPWAGVGLGVGPLQSALGRRLARGLSGAVGVAVRDGPSARLLGAIGVPGVRLAADLALSLPEAQVEVDDVVTVCLRPWAPDQRAWMPVGARRTYAAPDWLLDGMARALDDVHTRTGLPTRFVALQADRDDEVHRAVRERMSAPTELRTPGLGEVVEEVARGRVVISMRYHGGIAAVLAGRPSVLVGYSPKVDALAADLGSGAAVVDFDPEAIASIPQAVDEVIHNADVVAEARSWLRERELVNDEVLDLLLDRAG